MPLLGDAIRKAETARFASAMATLVANSVPLVQSIRIAGAILNNKKIAGTLDSVAQGVKRGEGLSGPLKRTGEFPALAGHLLTVGEETGRLDQMFAQMAEIYETDTRAAYQTIHLALRAFGDTCDGRDGGDPDLEYDAGHHQHQRRGGVNK